VNVLYNNKNIFHKIIKNKKNKKKKIKKNRFNKSLITWTQQMLAGMLLEQMPAK
jgi:hypothetical protein